MKIYLVRHGQSRWQIQRSEGDWNSPLTELGHIQAKHLAEWLARGAPLDQNSRLQIAQVYASPLIRAQETAAYTATALNLPINTDEHLREADFLVSEHLPYVTSPRHPFPPYTPTAVYARFKAQASQALEMLVTAAESGGPVLAVTHGGFISTMLRIATSSDIVSFWIYNTSLNLIEWKRGRWHLVHLNLWDHLPPELRTY